MISAQVGGLPPVLSRQLAEKLARQDWSRPDQLLLQTPEQIAAALGEPDSAVRRALAAAARAQLRAGGTLAPVRLGAIFTGSSPDPNPSHWTRIGALDGPLDTFLGGGIPVAGPETRTALGIVEVAGEAGVGKTALCLQLAIGATQTGGLSVADRNVTSAPGLARVTLYNAKDPQGAAVYISCDRRFSAQRLAQIARARLGPAQAAAAMDAVYVAEAFDGDSFHRLVDVLLPRLLASDPRIRLLVVDSIAAVWRGSAAPTHIDRMVGLYALVVHLHRLSRRFSVGIVLVNQAAGVPPGLSVPALGEAWSYLVGTRLVLSGRRGPGGEHVRRTLRVAFSPFLPGGAELEIRVTDGGLEGTPNIP